MVEECRYNGLNQRITVQYDVTDTPGTGAPDGKVDSGDPVYHYANDLRWRVVSTSRGADATPKETFVYHNAGPGGFGGSSYVDSVLLRDRDINNTGGWPAATDGTREERRYYCQNWRADMSVVLTDTATQVERVKYTAYGKALGMPAGDTASKGSTDGTDATQVGSWISSLHYDVRGDVNLDGVLDSTDTTLVTALSGQTMGYNVLTRTGTGNRKGYAGYEGASATSRFYHVRNRVLDTMLGRWTRRDAAGYMEGANLYTYGTSSPVMRLDPEGLDPVPSCTRLPSDQVPQNPVPPGTPCDRQSQGGPCVKLCVPKTTLFRTSCGQTPRGVEKVCCICDTNLSQSPEGRDPTTRGIIENCGELHEQIHRDDQPWCVVDPRMVSCCELWPTSAEIQCLEDKRSRCRDAECRRHIDDRIRGLRDYYRDHWKKCFAGVNEV